MDKQLIDPAMPTQGVQLEFTDGSDCDEPDDFAGDGQYHTRLNLICAPEAAAAQRFGWHRFGCTWEFSLRFAGACALAKPPGSADLGACSSGCLPAWKGDGVCDRLCNVSDCQWDSGDCRSLAPGWASSAAAPDAYVSAGDESAADTSLVEEWLCGVKASIYHRHGHGGGGGGSGDCRLDATTVVGGTLHGVSDQTVVWAAVLLSLAAVCLCGVLLCLCRRHAALQRESAQHRRLIAQYGLSEAARSSDEMGGMLEGGGGEGEGESGIVLQGVVHHVQRLTQA